MTLYCTWYKGPFTQKISERKLAYVLLSGISILQRRQNYRSQDIGRSGSYLYFQWQYIQTIYLPVSSKLLFCMILYSDRHARSGDDWEDTLVTAPLGRQGCRWQENTALVPTHRSGKALQPQHLTFPHSAYTTYTTLSTEPATAPLPIYRSFHI